MAQVLSLARRPKTFSAMVGAEKLITKLRGHMKQGREPQAYMFIGQTGSGKTTIARILALALQCVHQENFGDPCEECQRKRSMFDIIEINGSSVKKIDQIRMATDGFNYKPHPGNRRRIYILDEAHMLSRDAQNYLLKLLEDCPKTTIWIICTTEPESVIPTVRSRCTATYAMPLFGMEEIKHLVRKGLNWAKSERDSVDLVEALMEGGINSPRLILNAVEKYVSDPRCSASDAAKEGTNSGVDIFALNRCIYTGNWKDAARWLSQCNPDNAKSIRTQLMLYLGQVLVNSTDISDRNQVVAKAIKDLGKTTFLSDRSQIAMIAAVAYSLVQEFRKYTR